MKVIVDANIVFSAILSTNSKIADLILNSEDIFDFVAPDYLRTEIEKHIHKIALISKMEIREVEVLFRKVTMPISFYSGSEIPVNLWAKAEQIVLDIDPKDTPYLVFSIFYDCKIWSGDKALRNGLNSKGFDNIISTEELFALREKRSNK